MDTRKGFNHPVIDIDKCIDCGVCEKVCPGISFDYFKMRRFVFGADVANTQIGFCRDCMVAHAADKKLRFSSSSGGVVTALVIAALSRGKIDGAILTRMRKDKPLLPEVFIAKTSDEVIGAATSKYCPVPLNIWISTVRDFPESSRLAVVGLPCHIQGVRKAQYLYPVLKKKIKFIIGLICGQTPSQLATYSFLKAIGVNRESVKSLHYRGKGYPGFMRVELKDGTVKTVPYGCRFGMGGIFSSALFSPFHCEICTDHFSGFADVVCGDAWLPEYQGDKIGKSLVIARTGTGYDVLEAAINSGAVEAVKIDCKSVADSQKRLLVSPSSLARITVMRKIFKIGCLDLRLNIDRASLFDYLKAFVFCFFHRILHFVNISKIVDVLPVRFVSFLRLVRKVR
jgi:coenzyme F420 hydrogenase subunit beta